MKSLVPIILIVGVVGLFFFEIKPFYNEVKVLRAEGAEYDHALEMAAELGTLRNQLETKLSTFSQTDLARLDHFLPQQLDTVRIILDMDGLGVRNGLKLTNIKVTAENGSEKVAPESPQSRVSAASYQTVDVSFDFNATYPQALEFIEDVEESLRLLNSVKVDVAPDPKNPAVYNFKMNLETYWINR